MPKFLRWLDDNLLSLVAGFLILFIPLYPKLPLMDILPGYIVRIRLEDFFVSFSLILWIIWVIRGKTSITRNPLFKPIFMYLFIGLLSVASAIFITNTVPLEKIHIQKTLLHFIRRLEYFSLFFVFYSSVKNLRTVKIYLGILLVTVISVAIYGYGQKYLYWPAYSTMNREFSKGWVLYLTEHARVLSTFGGHYDLAAYIMMVLMFLWSLFFGIANKLIKVIVFAVIAMAFWTLILTASRISFLAYLFGISFTFLFWSFRKGLKWSLPRWFAVIFLSMTIMLSFGDLSERFTKLLRINERFSGIKSLLTSPFGRPPADKAMFLENNPDAILADITSKTDMPPTPKRPSDVYQDMPLLIPIATGSATVSAVPRTYSKTAFMYDLSTAIRFDALWPMALKGFYRNPLLGTGYATLNKTQPTEFTEAESTDNDFLRALGETGLLGFISFYGIIVIILYKTWRNINILKDPVILSAAAGLTGIMFGMLANASYIDVFESSKVAFSFWAFTGTVLAGITISSSKQKNILFPKIPDFSDIMRSFSYKIRKFIRSDLFLIIILLIFAFQLRIYKLNTPLADWHSWRQADTSSVTRNFIKYGISFLYPTYHDLSNVASGKDNPKGYRYVEFPLYNAASVVVDKIFVGYNNEVSGRLTSIFASLGTLVFIFYLTRKYFGRSTAFLAAFFFSAIPYSIFYSRVILPEPFLLFTSTGMLYFYDRMLSFASGFQLSRKRLRDYFSLFISVFIALAFSISSLLVKPYSGFLFIPMVYLWFKTLRFSVKNMLFFFLYFSAAAVPFLLWRNWISNFPEGIPAYAWLLNGDNIRFKGAFFFWIFADRIGRLISGYWGLALLVMGIMNSKGANRMYFYLWGFSMLLYVTVFATGNVRHDYYQSLLIPVLSVFLARGATFMFEQAKTTLSKIGSFIILSILVLFMLMFGWYHIKDFYNINHPEIVEAGASLERKSHDKALVIAPYNGDTAFLYQTRRSGWPIMQRGMEDMIKMGAQYYVSVNFDDFTKKLIFESTSLDPLIRKYKLIELTDKYVIIQLVPDKDLPK